MRNTLTRSLGKKKGKCDPETEILSVRSGDTFVLCSDGLTGHVSDDEIQAALEGQEQAAATQSIVDLAKARGGEDNITVLAVSVQ
jgi:serine/threonine protein phosphatase PrpC